VLRQQISCVWRGLFVRANIKLSRILELRDSSHKNGALDRLNCEGRDEMRSSIRAAPLTALLFFSIVAHAEGLTTSDGKCWLFCESWANYTLQPTVQPTATPATQSVQAERSHHNNRSGARETAAKTAAPSQRGIVWQSRAYPPHATRWGYSTHPKPAVASRDQTPAPQPAAHTPAPDPAPAGRIPERVPAQTSVLGVPDATAPEFITSASAYKIVPDTAPSAVREVARSESLPDEGRRRLAEAFADRLQQSPGPGPSPTAAAPRPPEAVAAAPPAASRSAVFPEIPENGWWPASRPGRAAVWLAILAAIALLALSMTRVRGRGMTAG